MTRPVDSPPSPGGQCSSPQHTLARFASLLGTFGLKETEEESKFPLKSAFVPNNDALDQLVESENIVASFPSLSLGVLEEEALVVSDSSKEAVEAHAVSNLGRPLRIDGIGIGELSRPKNPTESHVEHRYSEQEFIAKTNGIRKVPQLLLDHLSRSFSLLVEARLRAYIKILATHGVSLDSCASVPDEEKDGAILAVERKLSCLLDVGTRISIDNLVTHFGAAGNLAYSTMTRDGMEELTMPLGMAAGFDISIPRLTSGAERLAMAVKTSGTITGTFRKDSNLLSSVQVELDTHKLLLAMVHDAARVISIALDHANEVTTMLHPLQEASSQLSTSCDDVPVLKKECHPLAPNQHGPAKKRKLKLPDAASKLSGLEFPVVSPDLSALLAPPKVLPSLQLEPSDDADLAELSPQTCANIVDFVIGEVDDGCFFPCHKKKRRTDGTIVT